MTPECQNDKNNCSSIFTSAGHCPLLPSSAPQPDDRPQPQQQHQQRHQTSGNRTQRTTGTAAAPLARIIRGFRVSVRVFGIVTRYAGTQLAYQSAAANGFGTHRTSRGAHDADPGCVFVATFLALNADVSAAVVHSANTLGTLGACQALAALPAATIRPAGLANTLGLTYVGTGRLACAVIAAQHFGLTSAGRPAAVVLAAQFVSTVRRASRAMRQFRTEVADIRTAIAELVALLVTVAIARNPFSAQSLAGSACHALAVRAEQPLGTFTATASTAVATALHIDTIGRTNLALVLQRAQRALRAFTTASTAAVIATLLSRAVGLAALAPLADLAYGTTAVSGAGIASLYPVVIAGTVAAVGKAEVARTVLHTFADAQPVPLVFAAPGIRLADTCFTGAPVAPGDFRRRNTTVSGFRQNCSGGRQPDKTNKKQASILHPVTSR